MPIGIEDLLLGVLLPAVVCGLIALGGSFVLGKRAALIGIALGFSAGVIGLSGWSMPSRDMVTWLVPLALWGMIWGGLPLLQTPRLIWTLRLLSALGVWLIWSRYYIIFDPAAGAPRPESAWRNIWAQQYQWSLPEIITHAVVFIGAVTLLCFIFDLLLKRYQDHHQALLPTLLVVYGTGVAVCLVLAHSITGGQFMGALVACLGAVMVLSWVHPRFSLPETSATLLGLLISTLAYYTYQAADLKIGALVLLVLAPAVLLIPLPKTLPLWQSLGARLGMTAVALVVLMVLADPTILQQIS